jgi:hypothetical protein
MQAPHPRTPSERRARLALLAAGLVGLLLIAWWTRPGRARDAREGAPTTTHAPPANAPDASAPDRELAHGASADPVRTPAAAESRPAGLVLRGHVLDHRERPRAGVRITASRTGSAGGEGALVRAVTDLAGRFELEGLHATPHDVVPEPLAFERVRFEPERHAALRPHARDAGAELVFRLVPEVLVRGFVRDATTGAPVTRFFVDTTPTQSPDGAFECVPRLGSGFAIEARGYRAWACTEDAMLELARAGTCTVELQPDPDVGTLRIVVRDPEGAPVGGAHVQSFGATAVVERTDAQGRLELAGVRAGGFELQVWADGFTEVREELALERGATVERAFELRRAAPVALRVLDPLGRVAERAVIHVRSESGKPLPWRWSYARSQPTVGWSESAAMTTDSERQLALSDAEGRIAGLPPGRYVLHVAHLGAEDRDVPFEVDATVGRSLEVRFDVDPPPPR